MLRRLLPAALAIGLAILSTACTPVGALDADISSRSAAASHEPAASTRSDRTQAPTSRPTDRPRSTPSPTRTPKPESVFGKAPTGPIERATVTRVIDGDTIEVVVGGVLATVRYIGIDTPETVRPGTPVEWMGPEASAANRRLVAGARVVLEKDVSETDRYGRLLRYVWLRSADGGWRLVNRILVRDGFASVSTYPPDVKYTDALLLPAQRQARKAGRGLWGSPPPEPAPPAPVPVAGNCDASYPGVCIPPYPPDLDCGEVGFTNFAVRAPDLHGFDGDGDGVGCEG
jgi:micrococcal nuclease